ncbi:hypothetical protein N9N32_00165 [Alphaproteobacteria bacterium]|nr:hypothetical protein [Alphaproteobacteria bacterium]
MTKPVIEINGTSYTEDQLTEKQALLIKHIQNLDSKVNTAQFEMDQLTVSRKAFMDMLVVDLESTEEAPEESEE